MTDRAHLLFAVASGPELGVGTEVVPHPPRIVGRSKQCHLVIGDPHVSRRHLEVSLEGQCVRARTQTDAAPFRFRGALENDVLLEIGDEIVIGDTRLRVEVAAAHKAHTFPRSHDAVTLLGGRLTDVEGFAAVFALSEALESCDSRESFEATVSSWARHFIPAIEMAFRFLGADDVEASASRALQVATRAVGGRTVVTALAVQADRGACALDFTLAVEPQAVTDHLRRLLITAARLCALTLGRLHAVRKVERENVALRDLAMGSAHAFLGSSEAAERVARLVPRLAASDVSVLILGETGTGKSFVARLIHEASPRAKEPFRVLNCAAIPESLIEAELFGHERGAFTGAVAAREGAFESAGRGTLFLDELGELPLASQAKLLRAIEERRFERVGSNRTQTMHARVIAATNRDLEAFCKEGRFRSDLLYRLSVVTVTVPPLRERGDDLVLLARHLLRDLAAQSGRRVTGFSPAALEAVRAYSWPGNVRELRNAIEHALVLGDGPILDVEELPAAARAIAGSCTPSTGDPAVVRLPATLAELERHAIRAAIRAADGNMKRAAAILGIARTTLYTKVATMPDVLPRVG